MAPGGMAADVGRNVTPAASLRGELHLPADKSIAHRALLFNAMATGQAQVTLRRPGADVRSTAGALAALGAIGELREDGGGMVLVVVLGGGTPLAARLPGAGGEELDCGNSGTTMRLMSGALAGRPLPTRLVGDASLSGRPMERVAAPLRAMGAQVRTTDGHAPIALTGARPLRAMRHELPVASAQVLGATLLAGLAAEGTTVVEVPGPTRDHTERLLAWLGANVRREGQRTAIEGPAGLTARSFEVPGDISSAAAWLVAGALHRDADLTLRGVGLNPTRLGIVEVLCAMGADITVTPGPVEAGPEPVGDLRVRGGRPLRAIRLDGPRVADLIDELPLLGVAMAAVDGTSELRDAAELRVKESDRIRLVVSNLAAAGARAEELPDGWRVSRGSPREARIETGGDHRIAISFAVAALAGVAEAVEIDDPDCASVSYAGFWDDLVEVSR